MAAFAGPIVAFGCNVTHATYRKFIAWDEFTMGDSIVDAERLWANQGSFSLLSWTARRGITWLTRC